jgi:hypothetical protein
MVDNQPNQNVLPPGYITYTAKFWRLLLSGYTIVIPFLATCYFITTASSTDSLSKKIFLVSCMLFFGGLSAYILNRFLASSKLVLLVSEGNDIFYFGDDVNQNKYNKDDIEKVTIYQPGGNPGKSLHDFYVYEILFKDSSTIKFSNMLISEGKVLENFPSDLIRYGGDKKSFWRL